MFLEQDQDITLTVARPVKVCEMWLVMIMPARRMKVCLLPSFFRKPGSFEDWKCAS